MPRMTRMLFSTSPMMRGDDVLSAQRRLGSFDAAPSQDGLFGDETAKAVRRFQEAHGLEVDGIIGPRTWQALFGDAADASSLPPEPLAGDSIAALTAMHGYYQDGCRWRLREDGIEVEGTGLLTFSTPEQSQVSAVLTRFRQELGAALATHRVPVELVVACICAESGGNSDSVRMEPGCDRNQPESTPSRVSVGLMQTLLSTARMALRRPELRLAELTRPDVSILAGAAYLARQAPQTQYDPPLVAAAYNAGSLRYNGGADNRWKLLQYPVGTSRHVDRFLRSFNATMAMIETVELPGHVISLRRLLKGASTRPAAAPVAAPAQPDAGRSPGRTSGRTDIANAIRSAAAQFGADVETLAAMAFIESSLRVDVRARTSSAFGLFQFIDTTWAGVVQRHGAALGIRVEDRADLRAQCLMGAAFLQDNTRALQRALDRPPRPAECYAAHFFGVDTASRLLRGGREIAADTALGDRADRIVRANQTIFLDQGRMRTVGQVMTLFETKMDTALGQARDLLAAAPVETAVPDPVSAEPALPPVQPAEGAEPRWLTIARGELGQKEAAGAEDNPRIVEYFGATTLGPKPDSVSWCGAFVSFCLREAGLIEKGSARAADWLEVGDQLDEPRMGCIAVLKPMAAGASGHVGFWVGQSGNRIQLLAGNQNDRVDITAYPADSLQRNGLRWPRGA